jgi:hypothetical protein
MMSNPISHPKSDGFGGGHPNPTDSDFFSHPSHPYKLVRKTIFFPMGQPIIQIFALYECRILALKSMCSKFSWNETCLDCLHVNAVFSKCEKYQISAHPMRDI